MSASAVWLDAPQVAKLIRADLKVAFPAVKFSVKSSRYSMGSSVSVQWTDGPNVKQVEWVMSTYDFRYYDSHTDYHGTSEARMIGDQLVRSSVSLSASRKTTRGVCEAVVKAVNMAPQYGVTVKGNDEAAYIEAIDYGVQRHCWQALSAWTAYPDAPDGEAERQAQYLLDEAAATEARHAENKIRDEAERGQYVAPLQVHTPSMLGAVSILIHWSECGLFGENQLFSGADCWAQIEALGQQARTALIEARWGGYDKTKFTVAWPDGFTFSGRWDISANDHDGRTLADHILSSWHYSGHTEALGRYRVGPAAPKPRVKVWADGSGVVESEDTAPIVMTAAELLEVQEAARVAFAGMASPELIEAALALTSSRVTVTDHDGAVWLDVSSLPGSPRTLN